MAAICPNCHQPETIAYVVNDEGIHPFPCLECNTGTLRSSPHGTLAGATPCATDGCQGSVRDDYLYDAKGRLTRLNRIKCQFCGTDKTRKVEHASNPGEHRLPDPRLRRIASGHMGNG